MDKHIIGENAGRVWRLLSSDDQRRWEYSEIKDILGLNDWAVPLAGWLVRIRYSSSWNIITARMRRPICILC